MNRALVEQIVKATLYEGYLLYPYRASSTKNQRERFTFGRVYPEVYSAAQKGAERSYMQAECVAKVSAPSAKVEVSLRFLQPVATQGATPETWHEGMERAVAVPTCALTEEGERCVGFEFAPLQGTVCLTTTDLGRGLWKINARVTNQSTMAQTELPSQEALMLRLFASTHFIFQATDAEFISLFDPPPEAKAAAASCENIGVWPVLVGDEAAHDRDAMLASPIILYDYPKIAPESAGPLFDGTEIDEILTLRIQTLTDAEKDEMQRVDAQARLLLQRTDSLSSESLLRMHGAMRPAKDASEPSVDFDDFFGASTKLQGVCVGGVFLQAGHRVRLRPKKRADILDAALNGQVAIIEAVEQDLEKNIHLAVVLENDPGRDLGMMRQPGHRFFYGADEVEPMEEAPA